MQTQIKIPKLMTPDREGHQPKHYEWKGKHFLECSICGIRTAQYDTFDEAEVEWEAGKTMNIKVKQQEPSKRSRLISAALVAGLSIFMARVHADPCDPPTGWTGEIVGDTPNGPIVVTQDNLYFAAYNTEQYIFSFLPDAHRIIVPFNSVIKADFDIPTCTYYAEYQDDIFMDGFEGVAQ